jgi:hydrogenase-4 component E
MIHPVDTILALVLLSILFSFGSSRLPGLIKVMAFQGVVVSIVPFFIGHEMSTGGVVFTIVTLAIRGIVIPGCIYLAIKKVSPSPRGGTHCRLPCLHPGRPAADRRRPPLPAIAIRCALPACQRPAAAHGHFPAGAGMFLLMARRNAIAMVLGYIMMENGIYLVGTSFSMRAHHIVEFGILLDVLAGVMIMAIILQNIKQTFDDVDTARLRTLKE